MPNAPAFDCMSSFLDLSPTSANLFPPLLLLHHSLSKFSPTWANPTLTNIIPIPPNLSGLLEGPLAISGPRLFKPTALILKALICRLRLSDEPPPLSLCLTPSFSHTPLWISHTLPLVHTLSVILFHAHKHPHT